MILFIGRELQDALLILHPQFHLSVDRAHGGLTDSPPHPRLIVDGSFAFLASGMSSELSRGYRHPCKRIPHKDGYCCKLSLQKGESSNL